MDDLIAALRRGAEECEREGVAGWGNTMSDAADQISAALACAEALEREQGVLAAEVARLREALAECVEVMGFARIFVNSRERIKQPEGRGMYDAAHAKGLAALETPRD